MSKKQILIFPFVLVFIEIIVYLSTDMYLPALPLLTQEFGISKELVQYTLALWFLGSTSMQLIIGPLAIYYGRKLILLIWIALFIFTAIVCATTHNIHWFLL